MLKKTASIVLLLTFLSLTTFAFISVKGDNVPVIQVNPSTIVISEVANIFSVNVTITNVTCLCAWEVEIYYRNSILACINATEGPFLQTGGTTFWAENITNAYNSTHGRLCVGSTLLGQVPGVNGSGVLATITFQTQGIGNTTLHFDDTKLYDCSMPPQPIEHETIDGEVVVVGIHDVAVTDVTTSKTGCVPMETVGQNYSVSVYVNVENQGEFTETFNVTVYANTTIIETREVTLSNGNSTTITFTWNTTSFAKGNYTIWAYAWPVPRETDIEDNTYTDGVILVTIPGDVDGDFDVDIYDVVRITGIYNSVRGDPEFNPNCDLDDDGKITIYDVVKCTSHYGQKYP